MTIPRAFAATVVSAGLYALAFPPVSWWPLMWIALVPLLLVCARLPPARAAAWGLLWGVGMAYGVGWWFPGMIAGYFDRPLAVGWAAFLGASTLSAGIYYAAVCAWVSWLARRRAATPVVVAGAWVACELARTHLLLANPWALAAYSQVPWNRL